MKLKKKKKRSRKSLVKELDKVFSLFIRERDFKDIGGCHLGCGPIECCSHLITRSKHSVRWDERNAYGSCMSSNFQHEFNPHIYTSWYIKKHGLSAYEKLLLDSNKIAKFSNSDLEAMIEKYETK